MEKDASEDEDELYQNPNDEENDREPYESIHAPESLLMALGDVKVLVYAQLRAIRNRKIVRRRSDYSRFLVAGASRRFSSSCNGFA